MVTLQAPEIVVWYAIFQDNGADDGMVESLSNAPSPLQMMYTRAQVQVWASHGSVIMRL